MSVKVVVVFGNGTHVNLCLGKCCGMTSDLREEILELETIRASSLLVQEYAAALMRLLSVVSMVLPQKEVLEVLGQSPEVRKGADDGCVSQRVSSGIHAAMVAGKRCCPIPSQSRDFSG